MIFDCHRHVHPTLEYDLACAGSNYIFNDVAEYKEHGHSVRNGNSISLIFDLQKEEDFVREEFRTGRIQAFKIHSRRQRLAEQDYEPFISKSNEWDIRIPIIVDAFYFGQDLEYQPSLPFIVRLARALPNTPIVVAHAGGYELLKYFFHLRELPNIVFDLSFSLQYLADSSLYLDLKKMLRFWDRKRLMFGSDFFYASPKLQFDILQDLMKSLSYTPSEMEAVSYANAKTLFLTS